MKFFKWLAGLPIWAFLGSVIVLLSFAWLGWRGRSQETKAERLEDRAAREAAGSSHTAMDRARATQAEAARHRRDAAETKQRQADRLDRIGKSNATTADVIDRWNADRLRD